jgi:RNA-directed DNA polymerase
MRHPARWCRSPLLANIYMNRFLKHWRFTDRGKAFRAHVVNYADDFVILCQRSAVEALAWTRAVMTKLGLTLNEAKTSVKDARKERFDFLGYTFGPHRYQRNGNRYLGASPSEKSVTRVKQKINAVGAPATCSHGRRCATGSTDYSAAGQRTSPMDHVARHTRPSTIMSADRCDTSLVDA